MEDRWRGGRVGDPPWCARRGAALELLVVSDTVVDGWMD